MYSLISLFKNLNVSKVISIYFAAYISMRETFKLSSASIVFSNEENHCLNLTCGLPAHHHLHLSWTLRIFDPVFQINKTVTPLWFVLQSCPAAAADVVSPGLLLSEMSWLRCGRLLHRLCTTAVLSSRSPFSKVQSVSTNYCKTLLGIRAASSTCCITAMAAWVMPCGPVACEIICTTASALRWTNTTENRHKIRFKHKILS